MTRIKNLQKDRKSKIHALIIGSLAALILFVVLGMVSVLIKNPFFVRMTPIHFYDYLFLILTSMLSGAYIGLWHYAKNRENVNSKCDYAAGSGAIGGFFSFSCAICNKLLIWLIGLSGVVAYFMPIQPLLGVISVGLLAYALYVQIKNLSTIRNHIHHKGG
jgi:hypothetical protein